MLLALVVDLVAASDTGISQTDDITALDNSSGGTALTFDVYGTVSSLFDHVSIYADARLIGRVWSTTGGKITVTTDGTVDLTDGPHVITASQAGAGESAGLTISVDTTPPKTPTAPNLTSASDTGVSSSDNITNDDTPTFSLLGATPYFRFYGNANQISGDYEVGSQYTTKAQPDKRYDYTVAAVDVAGNVSAQSRSLAVTIDTAAPPPPPAPDLQATSDTGISSTDNITSDSTPSFDVIATPYFRLYRNSNQISGLWETGSNYTCPPQGDGLSSYAITAIDAAGNESPPSVGLSVTIDTAAPPVPAAPDLEVASDTGISQIDNITRQTSPILDVAAGAYWRFYRDGTRISALWQSGTAFMDVALADGTYRYTVESLDAAGNVSVRSAEALVTVDTIAPGAPGTAPDLRAASDTGISSIDNITNDNTPTFDLTGSPQYCRVYRGGTSVSGYLHDAASFTPASAEPDGTWSYRITAADLAGNESGLGPALAVTIDTIGPATVSMPFWLAPGTDTGTTGDDITTNLTPTFVLDPTVAPYFRFYRNGNQISADWESGGSYAPAAQPNGGFDYSLRAVDIAGNLGSMSLVRHIRFRLPAYANAGGDRGGAEGALVAFEPREDTTPEAATVSYLWDFGDGTPPVAGKEVNHRYADNGIYTARLDIVDAHGETASATSTVTITNVTPTLVLASIGVVEAGTSFSVADLGAFSDPGYANPARHTSELFTYLIDWGDGTAADSGTPGIDAPGGPGQATAGSFDAQHTFRQAGTFPVTVRLSDDDGGSIARTLSVTVQAAGAQQAADLAISNSDIDVIEVGDHREVTITVHNYGQSPSGPTNGNIFDPLTGLGHDIDIPDILPGGSVRVTLPLDGLSPEDIRVAVNNSARTIERTMENNLAKGLAVMKASNVPPGIWVSSLYGDERSGSIGRYIANVDTPEEFEIVGAVGNFKDINLTRMSVRIGDQQYPDIENKQQFGHTNGFETTIPLNIADFTDGTQVYVELYADGSAAPVVTYTNSIHIVPEPTWLHDSVITFTPDGLYHLDGRIGDLAPLSYTMPDGLPLVGGKGFAFGPEVREKLTVPVCQTAAFRWQQELSSRWACDFLGLGSDMPIPISGGLGIDPDSLKITSCDITSEIKIQDVQLLRYDNFDIPLYSIGLSSIASLEAGVTLGGGIDLDAGLTLGLTEGGQVDVVQAWLGPDIHITGGVYGKASIAGCDAVRVAGTVSLYVYPLAVWEPGGWNFPPPGGKLTLTLTFKALWKEWSVETTPWVFGGGDTEPAAPTITPSAARALAGADSEPRVVPPMIAEAQAPDGKVMMVRVLDVDDDPRAVDCDLYWTMQSPDGTWSTLAPLATSTQILTDPTVAWDNQGHALAAWVASDLTPDEFDSMTSGFDPTSLASVAAHQDLYTSYFDGATWSTPQRVTADAFPDASPSVGFDATGRAWITWSRSIATDLADPNGYEIAYSWCTPGGAWSGVHTLTSNSVPDQNPQIAFSGSAGSPHGIIGWLTGGVGAKARISYSTLDLDSFSQAYAPFGTPQPAPSWDSATNLELAARPDNTFMFIATENAEDREELRSAAMTYQYDAVGKAVGKAWQAPQVISHGGIYISPRAEITAEGRASVAWQTGREPLDADGGTDVYLVTTSSWNTGGPSVWAGTLVNDDATVKTAPVLWYNASGEPVVAFGRESSAGGTAAFAPSASLDEEPPPLGSDISIVTENLVPDLAGGDLKVVANPLMAGFPARLSVTVSNRGLTTAPPTSVAFYVGDPASGGLLLETVPIAQTLLAGESLTVSTEDSYTMSAGGNVFYAVVQPTNGELQTGNNAAFLNAQVAPRDMTGPSVSLDVSANPKIRNASVILTFNEAVQTIGEPDVVVVHPQFGPMAPSLIELSADGRTATLWFDQDLPIGIYTVLVRDSVADRFGNPLDGDDDGIPGGQFVTQTILPGTLTGTSGPDNYTLRLDPSGTQVQVFLSHPTSADPDWSIGRSLLNDTLAFALADGDDTFTLDFSNGNPVPSDGLNIFGGSGTNSLRIIGSAGADSLTFSPGLLTFGSASVAEQEFQSMEFDGGESDDLLTITSELGLSPRFNGGTGHDTLRVQGGSYAFSGDAKANSVNLFLLASGDAQVNLNGTQHLAGIQVSGSARVAEPLALHNTIVVDSLSVGDTGRLDLGQSSLILNYSGISPEQQIQQFVWNGLATGFGLIAGHADLGGFSQSGRTLAVFDNHDAHFSRFAGETVPTDWNQVLVKYTYLGDANADGKVDPTDYAIVDGLQGLGHSWITGDLNFDGQTTPDDYAQIDGNQGAGYGGAGGPQLSVSVMEVGTQTASAPPEPIPERSASILPPDDRTVESRFIATRTGTAPAAFSDAPIRDDRDLLGISAENVLA